MMQWRTHQHKLGWKMIVDSRVMSYLSFHTSSRRLLREFLVIYFTYFGDHIILLQLFLFVNILCHSLSSILLRHLNSHFFVSFHFHSSSSSKPMDYQKTYLSLRKHLHTRKQNSLKVKITFAYTLFSPNLTYTIILNKL